MGNGFEYDVFLSHSHKDKPVVHELAERLKCDGARVWLDEWEISPGDMIGLKIEEALEKSRCLVLVLSKHAITSDWVTLERHTAVFRDPVNRQRRLIPVRLDDVEIGDMLSQFAYVDWRIASDDEYAKLLAAIQPSGAVRPRNLADEIDPDWRHKLDRIDQTGAARLLVGEMLELGHPRCICFCWYGGEHDGVDVFHNRLEGEFDKVSQQRCWSARPEWPGVISRRDFCEMLCQTFEIRSPADLGDTVRKHFRGRRRQLLYVNHTPVQFGKELDPDGLREYLGWWDDAVLGLLEPQQHVVLGVSYTVDNAIVFRQAFETILTGPSYPFSDRFAFEVLSVLQPLKPEHLRTFFRRINMRLRLGQDSEERAIRIILESTRGEYDWVVRDLEVLIADGLPALERVVARRRNLDETE